mgnify:CR=1 FL=1
MSLLSKFTKRTNLAPLEKLAADISILRETQLENAVEDLFASTLRSTGLSSGISRELAARFGDSLKYELADKYFQNGSAEYTRATKEDICNNFLPGYADTSSSRVRDVNNNLVAADGVANNTLQFPSQIPKYYMSMAFKKYVRPAPQVQGSLTYDNGIVLPVPRKLEETFNMNVSSEETGLGGGATDIIQTLSTKNIADTDYSATDQSKALLASFAIQKFGELDKGVARALGQYLGSIPNPHLSAIFQGVSLRQHQFEWTFAPRNPKESVDLQKIVQRLKQNSLPTFSTVGTPIMQYPLMCQIKLQPWDSKGEPLIKYKPALLSEVRVSYTPNGIPSFFAGTTLPTFVQISLTFIETTYFTARDFGRDGEEDQLSDIVDGLSSAANTLSFGFTGYIGDTIDGITKGDTTSNTGGEQ